MKKGFTILLLLFYSISTFGIGANKICFFCNHTTATAVTTHQQQCGTNAKQNGCCGRTQRLITQKDNCIVNEASTEHIKALAAVQHTSGLFGYLSPTAIIHLITNTPLHNGLPLYIFHCTFRI